MKLTDLFEDVGKDPFYDFPPEESHYLVPKSIRKSPKSLESTNIVDHIYGKMYSTFHKHGLKVLKGTYIDTPALSVYHPEKDFRLVAILDPQAKKFSFKSFGDSPMSVKMVAEQVFDANGWVPA